MVAMFWPWLIRLRWHRATFRLAALLTVMGGLAAGGAARAELLDHTVPVQVLNVGGVCFSKPDSTAFAPGTANQEIWNWDRPNIYAVRGDVFAARPGLSIELSVSLGYYVAGRSYSMELHYPDQTMDHWDIDMGADGVITTGYAVADKEMLPTGIYIFKAFDGQRQLFSYQITVDGYGDNSLCEPQVA